MNQAPTQGFEKDVGYKTTHHLMYPESATDLENSTSLILIPFKTLDLEWIISALTTGDISKLVNYCLIFGISLSLDCTLYKGSPQWSDPHN